MSWVEHSLPVADQEATCQEHRLFVWRRNLEAQAARVQAKVAEVNRARRLKFSELAYHGYFYCRGCGSIDPEQERCERCGRIRDWQVAVPK